VHTGDLARIGDVALASGLPVHELRTLETDLEALFFELTESPAHRNRNLDGSPDRSSLNGGQAAPTESAVR
jgi:ABC-2 type transport system ATP-binding protein